MQSATSREPYVRAGLASRDLVRRIGPHRLPLACVLAACAIGQIPVLIQTPLVSLVGDSRDYLTIARHILAAQSFTNPLRTSGYPAFLALVFLLTSGVHLEAVVVAQTVLTITATLGVYLLATRVGLGRWSAAVVAGLVGANPYLANFERNILTESLAFWLIVMLFIVFECYARYRSRRALVWLVILCVASILTRPIFIFIS